MVLGQLNNKFKKKITAIIQARMNSRRLPGKVLMKIKNKEILWHVINRLKYSKNIDDIVVATTNHKEDDLILNFCKKYKIKIFRGSSTNVLDRYLKTAKRFQCSNIVRITADCPLIDPKIVDEIINIYKNSSYEMVSLGGEFPDGLDNSVFSYSTLKKISKYAKKKYEKEHILQAAYNNKKIFKILDYEKFHSLSYHRWTIDEKEDFDLINKIFNSFTKKIFYTGDILSIFNKKPSLLKINSHIIRNEGLLISKNV